jgi:hypothetical protein
MQCLVRLLGIAKALAMVPRPAPLKAESLQAIRAMMVASQALSEWISSNKEHFEDIGHQWFVDCYATERAVAVVDSMRKEIQEEWVTSCAGLLEVINAALPPRALLEDPGLLTDTEKQKTLIKTMGLQSVAKATHWQRGLGGASEVMDRGLR